MAISTFEDGLRGWTRHDMTSQLPLILAVQPNLAQACLLRQALSEQVSCEVVVAETTLAALSVIDERIPDVILLRPLILPSEEDYLVAYLRTLAHTAHVQVIALPELQSSPSVAVPKPSLFSGLRRRPMGIGPVGCDPRSFCADVAAYLTRARESKQRLVRGTADQALGASDRRGGYRWSPVEVPWVSAVRLTAVEQADLINVSVSGALIRTPSRPALSSLTQPDIGFHDRPGLTFQLASGAEVRATGRVVRCDVRSGRSGPTLYEVAFHFDQSVGLDFPTVIEALDADTGGMRRALLPPSAAALHADLLARLARAHSLEGRSKLEAWLRDQNFRTTPTLARP